MKAFPFIFSAVLAVAGFSSCKTTMLVPRNYDTEIVSARYPASIVFINNFDYTNPDIVYVKDSDTYKEAVRGFISGFGGILGKKDSLRLIIGDSLRKETGAGMLTILMPVEAITGICNRYNADILVTLDSIVIGFNSNYTYLETLYYIEFFPLVNLYSRRFFLFAEFFLTAYNPAGDMINRSSVDKTDPFSWRMAVTAGVAFPPSIASAAHKIGRTAFLCGTEYSRKFYSEPELLQRQVYTGSAFTRSNDLMREWKWAEAVRELETLTKSSSQSIARKAFENLDVAKEGARCRQPANGYR